MPNELNKLFTGLTSGLGQVGNALIENDKNNSLHNLYTGALEKMNRYINPQGINRNTGVNEQGMLNPPEQQAPDWQNALKSVYDVAPDLLEYGDKGKEYAGMLEGLYKGSLPSLKEMKVGNDVYIIDERTGAKVNEIKGQSNLKPYTGEIVKVKKNEDNTYTKTVPLIDDYGNITYKTMPADETDFNIFEAQSTNKSTDWLEKQGVLQQNKMDLINFRFDLTGGDKKGSSRSYSGKVDPNEIQEKHLNKLIQFNQMNYDYDKNKDNADWIEKRRKLETDLQTDMNLSEQELKDLAGDIGLATEKMQKNIIVGKDQGQTIKKLKEQMVIASNLQNKFKELQGQLENGKITGDEMKQTLLNWFNKNGGALPDTIREQIMGMFKANGIQFN